MAENVSQLGSLEVIPGRGVDATGMARCRSLAGQGITARRAVVEPLRNPESGPERLKKNLVLQDFELTGSVILTKVKTC